MREVEERERPERHRRLGVDVEPARDVDDRGDPFGPGLDGGLDEEVQRLLDGDEPAGVLEGDGGAGRVVHRAAHDPVELVGDEHERELAHEVERPVGQRARGELAKGGHHRPGDATDR